MRFAGASQVGLSADKADVVVKSAAGEIVQRHAIAYQMRDGARIGVNVRYELHRNEVILALSRYDKDLPVTIDPALFYSTVLNQDAVGQAIAAYTDSTGHSYTYIGGKIGTATVPSFGFIAKFDTSQTGDASALYVTYFGGSVFGMTADSAGNLYAVGGRNTAAVPIVNGFASSGAAFLTKFSPDGGNILYSTLSGTSGANDYCNSNGYCWEKFASVAVDGNGTAYVAGQTNSGGLPQVNPFQSPPPAAVLGDFGEGAGFIQAVATTSSGAASLLYSSYLSGSNIRTYTGTNIAAIALDSNHRIYLAGSTIDPSFPLVRGFNTTPGGSPFVAVLDSTRVGANQLVYSTLLAAGRGSANAIAVDPQSNVYVAGTTNSLITTTPGVYQPQPVREPNGDAPDAFLVKLNPLLTGSASLLAATYLGGNGDDSANSLALDAAGNVFIAGQTSSYDFPLLNPTTPTNSGLLESLDRGNTWRSLGNNLRATTGKVATQSLIVDATTSPRTFFVGTDQGVFKSTDGGLNWSAANTGLLCTQVMALVADPSNASILYTATPSGVFISKDGASSWSNASAGLGNTANSCAFQYGWYARFGFDGNQLYLGEFLLGAPGYMYRTSTGGTLSWTHLPAFDGLHFSFAFDPTTTPHTIYGSDGLHGFRSTDGGTTFQTIYDSGSCCSQGVSIAVDTSTTPSALWLFDPYNSSGTFLAKSTDHGTTWTMEGLQGLCYAVSCGESSFALDTSTSPRTIYLSGSGVQSSSDGGTTWSGVLASSVFSAAVVDPYISAGNPAPVYVFSNPVPSAFVAQFDSSLSTLKFSTLLGGLGDVTYATSIALDPSGTVFVGGYTATYDFPKVNAYSPALWGAFLAAIGTPTLPASSGGPVSTAVPTSTGTLSLTFPNITGSTSSSAPIVSITPMSSDATSNLSLSGNLSAFDISTTALYSGSVTVCLQVFSVNDPATFSGLMLLHIVNGVAVNISSSYDFPTRTICGTTTSFSPFIVVKGVTGQIQDLIKAVNALDLKKGIQTSLDSKLQNAQSAYASAASHDYASVCNIMSSFISAVQAQIGQPLTTADAAPLIAAAKQIKATVGCK
jgi:hypothetical protein